MAQTPPTPPRTIPVGTFPLSSNEKIDVCRGLFAFLVVIAHSVDISWAIHRDVPGSLPVWLHDLLLYVLAAGVYWVIGFFVISGYCIQLSVERQIEKGAFPLKHYIVARLSRILPLYFLAILSAVVIERLMSSARPPCWPNGVNLGTLIAQLLVVQNLTQTYGSFAPSWSITNEMFYYLFYGGIVWIGLRRGIRPTSLGMALCLVFAVALDGLYFTRYRTAYVRSPGLLFGLGIIWFSGALVAEYRGALRDSRLVRLGSHLWIPVLLAAIAVWYSQRVHLQVVYLVLGAAFTLMLIRFLAADGSVAAGADRGRWGALIRLLGLSSYPTYLFHGPIVMLTGSAIMRWHLVDDWRITCAILAAVGIASGVVLGHVAERPLMAWRAGYLKRLRQADAGTARAGAPILGIQQ